MSNTYGFYTLLKKEIRRFQTVWTQTVISPVISNLLFLAVFGLSLNRAMPDVNGISYLGFLVPGLIAMGMMNNAFQNPSSSIIIAKYNNTIEDLLTLPLNPFQIEAAYTGAAIVRGLVVGLATLITMLLFVKLPLENIGLVLLATLALNTIFGLLGTIVGIWSEEFDHIAMVLNFILTPLIYLGGVFYSIDVLPELFQKLSSFNPFAYMIDLLRGGFTGHTTFPIHTSLIVVAATILGLH